MDQLKKYYRNFAYLAGFFLTIHIAFPSYFNASFLNKYLEESNVGLIFALASILAIIFLTNIPRFIDKYGKVKVAIFLSVLNIAITFPLIWFKSTILVVLFFLLYYAIGLVIKFDLDLYLEDLSDDKDTGRIRGIFLTAVNLAWLASPLLAGSLIEEMGFAIVYLLAASSLLPFIYLLLTRTKELGTNQAPSITLRQSIIKLFETRKLENKNVFNILVVDFLLNLFYAVMVIYTALYLENYIHLTKGGIGIAFTVMLLPFVLFEYPLGRLADKYFGEKEILVGGMVLTGLATLFIPLIETKSIAVWAFVLFATRVGACAVEIMKETYLFKHVDSTNGDIICISRNSVPFADIIGPILGALFISCFGLQYLFTLIGVIMILGVHFALKLQDTK